MPAICTHLVYKQKGQEHGVRNDPSSLEVRIPTLGNLPLVHGQAVRRGGACDPNLSQTRAGGGAVCLASGGIPVTPPRPTDQGTEVGNLAAPAGRGRHRTHCPPLHLAL